ncbi:hypothetical protein J2W49_000684 [Hydrogenophaga palleronii]|uniref:Uncharacterized protein n=1 Tax=Hydrogenophaga palleronii TaxID=65655 RepID=A0ABU1WI74_9BURK|nr:hypothetical protein [Hydrogenophaga palleronii]MDR7148756.1 hypothetical protein [Hydrogenophaga palleronii]
MSFDIDLTSLLAGISITAVGGWISYFIAFRKDERTIQIEQVTKERTKWRDNMRKLCEEITNAHVENRVNAIPAKVASLRARLATSINPKDSVNDGAILVHYDQLFSDGSDDLKGFTHRIALLLKHDWERVKWECTPLYVKPFKHLSKMQREWRHENYRENEALQNNGTHMLRKKEEPQTERFFRQLIEVKLEEITLKFIFDNIRNYGIAATVIVAGIYLAQHGAQANNFPGAGIVFGILLVATGFALYVLNLCQSIWAIAKLKVGTFYLISSMAVFLGTSELLWVLIKQYMHKG